MLSHTCREVQAGSASRSVPAGRLRWLACCTWLALWAATLSCQHQSSSELLLVSALAPAQVHLGERVSVVGDGFALNNASTVRLRGRVHRAGVATRAVDISLPATTESQHRLSVILDRSLQVRLCGGASEAAHATFEGDVEVAIAAKARGAPPVTGVLRGALLELYPADKTPAAEARALDRGRRALDFFGMDVAPLNDPDGGLSIVGLEPGGRAATAGLTVGDRLVRAEGLSVLQPSDLVPQPSRRLRLEVVRDGRELSASLASDAFSPQPPLDLAWASTLLGALSLAFLLYASPLMRPLAWLHLRLARLVPRRSEDGRARTPGLGARPLRAHALNLTAGALAWIFVGAALISPLLRDARVEPLLGLLLLYVAALSCSVTVTLVRGGRVGRGWSMRRGLRAAFHRFFVALPAGLAMLSVGFERGIDGQALVAMQGPMPWQWHAFANPGFSLLLLASLSTTLPDPLPRERVFAHVDLPASQRAFAPDGVLEWLQVCALCAVVVLSFLGGDALPESWGDLPPMLRSTLSALMLLGKYLAVVGAVLIVRAACAPPTAQQWSSVSVRAVLPLSLLAVVAAHFWPVLPRLGGLSAWVATAFGPASVGLLVVGLALGVARLWRGRRPPPLELSPWL